MDTAAAAAWWPCELEIRQDEGERVLSGAFPYNALATVRDRGRIRKERFEPGAFDFPINRFITIQNLLQDTLQNAFDEALATRERRQALTPDVRQLQAELASLNTDLLVGHNFGAPLASRLAGTLDLRSDGNALTFTATLPPEGEQPSWMVDALRAVNAGLVRGISPGFRVPPSAAVPDAERTVQEPGNPGVYIRSIRQAMLPELSLVTRPAYQETDLQLRDDAAVDDGARRLAWL